MIFNRLSGNGSLIDKLQKSIVRQLLLLVFSIYLLFTVVITIFHMYVEYANTKELTVKELFLFEQIIKGGLAESLWNLDYEQLQLILDGAINSRVVVGAKVVSELDSWNSGVFINDGKIFQYDANNNFIKEIKSSSLLIPHEFNIYYKERNDNTKNKGVFLGKATIYSSNEVVFELVKFGFFLVVITTIIKIFILWILFLIGGLIYVSNPLSKLLRVTQKLTEGKRQDAKKYLIHEINDKNEIGILAESFSNMIKELEIAETELLRTQKRTNKIVDLMPSALIALQDDGKVIDCNHKACDLLNLSKSKLIGHSIFDFQTFLNQYFTKIKNAIFKKKAVKINREELIIDEKRMYFDFLIYPISFDDFSGIVCRIDDITNQIHLENAVRQSEKMSSIGTLAAGVAHEINNPLGSIIQGGQNVLRRIDINNDANIKAAEKLNVRLDDVYKYLEDRKIIDFIQGIRDSGVRAANIVKNLLQFTRRSSIDKGSVNIIEVLEHSLELVDADMGLKKIADFSKVKIIKDFEMDLPTIRACHMELEQVFINIIKNAVYAMTLHNKPPILKLKVYKKLKEIFISIEDNGPGMPDSVKDKIFEPFYTTKPIGHGTGLGLSVCYNIITESHNGTMIVSTSIGGGTKFIISLPEY